jgi:hypothetical protein
LAPSSYYHRAKPRSAKAVAEEARLVVRIREICAEFPRYGYRRVTAQLKAEGERVNHKRVSRIMRERDLRGRPERRLPAPPRRRELSSLSSASLRRSSGDACAAGASIRARKYPPLAVNTLAHLCGYDRHRSSISKGGKARRLPPPPTRPTSVLRGGADPAPVVGPSLNDAPGLSQAGEPARVEAFLAEAAVEALDRAVLNRLARVDEEQPHAVLVSPAIEVAAAKFRPVVDRQHVRVAAFGADFVEPGTRACRRPSGWRCGTCARWRGNPR